MKVQILMPTYNAEKFITKQIETILKQTYKDFQLLICDDGSNDNTVNIIESFISRDNRIVLIKNESNLGYVKNYEKLLSLSTADYIFFSDHDDIWLENKIEDSLNLLIKDNTDLVFTDLTLITDDEQLIHNSYFKMMGLNYNRVNQDFLNHTNICAGCTMGITKSLRDKVLPFKPEVKYHDQILCYLASINKGMSFLNKPTILYRQHSDNYLGAKTITGHIKHFSKINGKSYNSYLDFRKWVIDFKYIDTLRANCAYNNDIKDILLYIEEIAKVKYIDISFINYLRYIKRELNLFRFISTFILFHMPIIGYLVYLVL